jgi:ABC-type Zn uptake system ZnuABC Zn-binding protein ZnuA
MLRKTIFLVMAFGLTACRATPSAEPSTGLFSGKVLAKVLAVESFLADIAQNVAGDRVKVDTLMPLGMDPHSFEPTPKEVAKVADCQVLIINGAGFEEFLNEMLKNAGGSRQIIEVSIGLTNRTAREGEADLANKDHLQEEDPHFWLDPNNVIHYAENIRDGLSQADPTGVEIYAKNTDVYITQLKELDAWIASQVEQIPLERRLLVTNHESLGYFADRYGFTIVGAVIPSVSTSASPSAQQMAALAEEIKASGAPAIFVETGSNPQLAKQLAGETGVKIVSDLYTHSLSGSNGPAPTYIEMMHYNVQQIVDALLH